MVCPSTNVTEEVEKDGVKETKTKVRKYIETI